MPLFSKLSLFFWVVLFFSCDAHMQKGLQVYQERYTPPDYQKPDDDDFFLKEDNIDIAFPVDQKIVDRQYTGSIDYSSKTTSTLLTELKKISYNEKNLLFRINFIGNGPLGRYSIKQSKKRKIIKVTLFDVKNTLSQEMLDGHSDWVENITIKQLGTNLELKIVCFPHVAMKYKIRKTKYGFGLIFKS